MSSLDITPDGRKRPWKKTIRRTFNKTGTSLLLSIGYNLKELQEQKEEDTQKIDVLLESKEKKKKI